MRSSKNLAYGAARSGSAAVVNAVQSVLSDAQKGQAKAFRRDGVKAIEYMLTASPEWWKTATPKAQAAFFDCARRWLREKHGAGCVVAEWIHLDERSKHAHIVCVPLHQGRPNARHFLGGAKVLSALQDEFANLMQPLGLQRGTRSEKGAHLPVSEWWGVLDRPEAKPSKADYLRKAVGLTSPRVDQSERQAVAFKANKKAVERLRERAASTSKAASDNALEASFLAFERQKILDREARILGVEKENLVLRQKLAQFVPNARPDELDEGYFTSLGLG